MPERIENRRVWSLSEITKSIQSVISKAYKSNSYWIKAEMVKLNHYPQSGHCYPDLAEKQDGKLVAQLRANIWRDDYQNINNEFIRVTREPLKDGLMIMFRAQVKFHSVHGLSLAIIEIDPNFTLGDMARQKKETLDKLKAEGIFDRNKRVPFPKLPQRIAIISVDTSKGYADFINKLETNGWNYKFFHLLFPSVLQGDRAVESITKQLNNVKKVISHFDVVAIIRGGGGDIGLNCYDDYRLAKEVALFPIPVLAGIGHSTNETIVQMVSFKNNITPTATAEFLIQHFHNFSVPVQKSKEKIFEFARNLIREKRLDLSDQIRLFKSVSKNLLDHSSHHLSEKTKAFQYSTTLFTTHARNKLNDHRNHLKNYSKQKLKTLPTELNSIHRILAINIRNQLEGKNHDIDKYQKFLDLVDPANVLKRGYSITYLNGKILSASKEAGIGDELTTELYKGKVKSKVISKDNISWKKKSPIQKHSKN